MGAIKDILAERHIGEHGLYNDHARIEISENIHFHWRDSRLVMSADDFEILSKIFSDAYKAYEEAGKPVQGKNPYKDFTVFAEEHLTDTGFHSNRLGLEEEEDGSIHLHYRDLRLHLKPADFLILAQQMWLAYLQYNKQNWTSVSLDSLAYHPVVSSYITTLSNQKYVHRTNESVDSVLRCKWHECHGTDIKRPNGLPKDFPGSIPEYEDEEHLLNLLNSIKIYGYAKGPYRYQLMRVYKQKDGTLYAKDSHRLACLLYLGYEEAEVLVVNEESGWRE